MNKLRYYASASFAVAKHRHAVVFIFVLLFAGVANGQNLPVYDDSVQNAWQNYSYGPDPGGCVCNFTSTAVVHAGTYSISFTPSDNPGLNAVAFARTASPVTTAQYPVIHFWIHGGATGGQQLAINLGLGEPEVSRATAALDTYITGGGVAAGQWREVTVNITQPPLSYNGSFDRIDLYTANGAQQILYIDDVSLTQAAAPPPANALQVEHDVTVAAMRSDRFTWQDSSNQTRKAALAHNDPAEPGFVTAVNGTYGGAMREFQYRLPNGTTRIANVTTYGNGGYGGFGYVVNHSNAGLCVGDDSPLGDYFPGQWQRIFESRHHAIFRFTQNYPRNCPNAARTIPVTIEWMFSTGHDNPLYAITYDVSGAALADILDDDSRAPYGEFNIDGDGFTNIDGVAWGDRFKFTSTLAPVTLNSTWTYNQPNSVPYVKEWIAGALTVDNKKDATMGLVQTQTMTQQDAGGARNRFYHDITLNWGKTSADGNAGGAYKMPYQDEWAYQANANSVGVGVPNNNARMTWRTQFGFLGQTTYDAHDEYPANPANSSQPPGYPKKSYSVYVVLGTHSSTPVERQITQVETVQTLTLTATTGSVVTSGPAGVARVDAPVTYQPAGYNHVYGALAFNAAGNQLDATIGVGAGTLEKPLIIIGSYTGADPVVKLGGATLVADADFFASLRPTASELWITLNRDLAGNANQLQINPPGGVLGAPTGVVATAITGNRVDITWNAVAGASSYEIDRMSSLAAGFSAIGTPMVNSFSDTDVAIIPNKSYLYRVRAVNGGGASGNSASDLATTYFFINPDPVANATFVKAADLADLRITVNDVRALANLGAFPFTDNATPNVRIRAVHMTELRSALDAARQPLGLPFGGYTDPALLNVRVKAVHFQELRDRVR